VNARCHRDPQELLAAKDIDAVVVAAPPLAHASLASAALRASKHVYVEKPLATCVEDARRLAVSAADAGVAVVFGFHRRVHPTYQRARSLLGEGAIGRVRGVHTVFAEPSAPGGLPAWKRKRDGGGGVLLDLAVHHLDQLRWMLAREIAVVDCMLSSAATEQDGAVVRLRSDDGIEVQARFSFRDGPADVIEFFGERGTLRVDRHRSTADCRVPRRWDYGTRASLGLRRDWGSTLEGQQGHPPVGRAVLSTGAAGLVARLTSAGRIQDDLAEVGDGVRAVEIVAEAEARAASRSSVREAPNADPPSDGVESLVGWGGSLCATPPLPARRRRGTPVPAA
jgi:predicted dehydrogenase